MSIAGAAKPDPSPWLSVWSSPGDTIERVLTTKSWLYSLYPWLLAAGATAAHDVAVRARMAGTVPLLDWHFLLAGTFNAFAIGAADLCLYAFIMRWSGRMVGGRASFAQLCAVFSWGRAPVCAALVIDVTIILAAGGATGQMSAAAINVMKEVGLTVNVWTAIATIAMLRRVQAFDLWRAIFNYAASIALGFLFVMLIKSYLFPLFNMLDLQ
jgi:hypothetical protein